MLIKTYLASYIPVGISFSGVTTTIGDPYNPTVLYRNKIKYTGELFVSDIWYLRVLFFYTAWLHTGQVWVGLEQEEPFFGK